MGVENEGRNIPEWACQERERDLAWIAENLPSFWPAARVQFAAQGRGVIVIDTTVQPDSNAGHPMYYVSRELAEQTGDEDVTRMLNEYAPEREFIALLLKPEERTSTYRVQAVQRVERGRPRRGR